MDLSRSWFLKAIIVRLKLKTGRYIPIIMSLELLFIVITLFLTM